MEMKDSSFFIGPTLGTIYGSEMRIPFPREVVECAVGLSGFSTSFEDSDENFGQLQIELRIRKAEDDPNAVIIGLTYCLRDYSGRIDNRYSGNVLFTVLADLVKAEPPRPTEPRQDLLITGMEVTQGIQHFRSAKYLRHVEVYRDNSIPLVAHRRTGIRLYVDYDANAGLAPIQHLKGDVEVIRGSNVKKFRSINVPQPRRDRDIMRSQEQHTVNFLIDQNECRGIVTFKATVFSASDDTQFSAVFQQTFWFIGQRPVPICLVAVNYIGDSRVPGATAADLEPPSFPSMHAAMSFANTLFPIGSYNYESPEGTFEGGTIEFNGHKDADDDACDFFEDLFDDLKDLRGDSETLYVAMTNKGVVSGGGCGGGGLAALPVSDAKIIAHELGHAIGLYHAPCDDGARCGSPDNVDDDYPAYPGYASDSIGEIGFNTNIRPNRRVYDPHDSHDVMSYSGTIDGSNGRWDWISPYHYLKICNWVSPDYFSMSEKKTKTEKLFLKLTMDRDRIPKLASAFHFAAGNQSHGYGKSPFSVGLLDAEGRTLKSVSLEYASIQGSCCGSATAGMPLKFVQAIPYHRRAKMLAIYEHDKVLSQTAIPDRPKVKFHVEGAETDAESHLSLNWSAVSDDAPNAEHWYLVQTLKDDGSWRGVAPRTRKTSMKLSKLCVQCKSGVSSIRVLATSGIATGVADWTGKVAVYKDSRRRRLDAGLVAVPTEYSVSAFRGGLLQLVFFDQSSADRARRDVRWYDDRGHEVSRGDVLDASEFGTGVHVVYAVDATAGVESATPWTIQRHDDGMLSVYSAKESPARTAS